MNIDLKEITIKTLTNGFEDSDEAGVVAYGGKLDIRPPYQREFIYKDKQRDAVIDSVRKDFPLNVMYWAVRDDGKYEVIDGQQRTLSICQYVNGDFSINQLAFHGIDRQKNSIGYVLTNCVPCCWRCNALKGPMDEDDFLDLLEAIVKRRRPYCPAGT